MIEVGDLVQLTDRGETDFGCVTLIDNEKAVAHIQWFGGGKETYGEIISFWAYGHSWHKVKKYTDNNPPPCYAIEDRRNNVA